MTMKVYSDAVLRYAIMLWRDLCLSVCLSRSRIVLKQAYQRYVQIFSPSGSHTVLVFTHEILRRNYDDVMGRRMQVENLNF